MIHHLMCPFYRMMNPFLKFWSIRDFIQVFVEVVGARCPQEDNAKEYKYSEGRNDLEPARQEGERVPSSRHCEGCADADAPTSSGRLSAVNHLAV